MTPSQPPPHADLARFLDHTLLKAEATERQVRQLCAEAAAFGFASVCVNGQWVSHCAKWLAGTTVKTCTVIGFPLGASHSAAKAAEVATARAEGATEFDMVLAIGALKSGMLDYVEEDIRAVVQAAQGLTVKVILETCLLADAEIIAACDAAARVGAHFVKTSTGFSNGGATTAHVRMMRDRVPANMEVKASGGIRTTDDARAMLGAGATRLGTSQSLAIIGAAAGTTAQY